MKKIVYIAGLGHSGSTVLDMALGAHPNIIGLGEIYAVLNHKDFSDLFQNSTCSCGKKGEKCSFWKDVKQIAESGNSTDKKYQDMLNVFYEQFGENTILVDSSKNSYKYLKMLDSEFDLRVIYLTRDFRTWSYSRFTRVKKPLFNFFCRWFLENKKLLHVFKRLKLKTIKVGYEELALFPEYILKKISAFIDVPFSELMLKPSNTKSHIINGNIVRVDKLKMSNFFYDPKWLVSKRLNLVSVFFIPIQSLNNKLVYSNLMRGKVKSFGKKTHDFYIFGNKHKEELNKNHN